MKMKNDCQVDYIKEAFDKLYNCVMPFIDLTQFADADTAFKELDKKVHSEIYILKKCLAETKESAEIYHCSAHDMDKENDRLREVIDGKEKEINSLKKKIHELEQKTADDAIRIKSLERANSALRGDNKILWSKLEECDIPKREQASYKSLVEAIEFQGKRIEELEAEINTLKKKIHELEEENANLRVAPRDIGKRIWHTDGNAWTCCENLAKAIEFQNKKIEELEAEKARLKEAYDIHETTIKKHKENVDLSYGHEFEFGDEVFVPWSDAPYMYVKTGLLYNTRTKRLVYVGKDQHLKWFGEKFTIV